MSIELYKSKGIHSSEYLQSERRHALLELQRQRRNDALDQHRSIEPLKKVSGKYPAIKNQIMLSEWLKDLPDDIENWYVKPCPKGTRVLVIANDGLTRVFNKYGALMRQFRTEFPGDARNRHNSMTILDCVYAIESDEYFVLDVLAYGSQALTDCEAEFRFFWLESQMHESNFHEVSEHHEYPFRIIEKVSCSNVEAFNQLLAVHPIWPNNQPQLDGFLFYHKEASYVHGKTPLVGWLFAFMIPELFPVPFINEIYLNEKPANYSDYTTFIKQFDEDLRKKQKKRRDKVQREHQYQMDEEEQESIDDGNNDIGEMDSIEILRETIELETNDCDDMDAAK